MLQCMSTIRAIKKKIFISDTFVYLSDRYYLKINIENENVFSDIRIDFPMSNISKETLERRKTDVFVDLSERPCWKKEISDIFVHLSDEHRLVW